MLGCLKNPILTRRSALLHQLLVVVKVDPHVLNCPTMSSQDGGLRDKFNPEKGEGEKGEVNQNLNLRIKFNLLILEKETNQNLNLGIRFLFGFKASELSRNLSSSTLPRVSETCLEKEK